MDKLVPTYGHKQSGTSPAAVPGNSTGAFDTVADTLNAALNVEGRVQ